MSPYQTPEATVLAAKRANPAVHRQVLKLERLYPQLNGRALRAGLLAAGGAVQPDPASPAQAYQVTSANGNGRSYRSPSAATGRSEPPAAPAATTSTASRTIPTAHPPSWAGPSASTSAPWRSCAAWPGSRMRRPSRRPSNGRSQRYESASAPSMARTWVDAVRASQGRAR